VKLASVDNNHMGASETTLRLAADNANLFAMSSAGMARGGEALQHTASSPMSRAAGQCSPATVTVWRMYGQAVHVGRTPFRTMIAASRSSSASNLIETDRILIKRSGSLAEQQRRKLPHVQAVGFGSDFAHVAGAHDDCYPPMHAVAAADCGWHLIFE
jgi:hypothetical protein